MIDDPSAVVGSRTEVDDEFIFDPGSRSEIYWPNDFEGCDVNTVDFLTERNEFYQDTENPF